MIASGRGRYLPLLVLLVGSLGGEPRAQTCFSGPGINCGQTPSGSITVGTGQFYSFDAQAGEVLSITVAEVPPAPGVFLGSFEPVWALFPPAVATCQVPLVLRHFWGATTDLCPNHDCCQGQCESQPLPATGTYTIGVRDGYSVDLGTYPFGDGSGNYNLDLGPASGTFNGGANGPPDPVCTLGTQSIDFAQTIAGQINVIGETDTFTFASEAGVALTITIRPAFDPSGRFQPNWRLFAPDGTLLPLVPSQATCLVDPRCCVGACTTASLPAPGGTFTIQVSDNPWDGTGVYELSLARCGNGILEAGEGCDAGTSNGTTGACCNADCTFRAAGQACRSAATVCDAPETCDGTSAICPPDGFAPPGTLCADGDPCTDEDVCVGGGCSPGARVCDVTVSASSRVIRVECEVVRANVVGGGQAFCEARAVFPPASTAVSAAQSAEPACESSEKATRKRRRVVQGEQTELKLKLNRRARRALNRARQLGLQVCAKIGLPDNRTITVEKPVIVVAP